MNTVRTPNLQKSISAKLSTSRFLTQTLGFGKGLIPDIKKKKYNKRYRNKVHTIVEMSKRNNNSNMMQIKSERISEIQKSLKSKGFYQGAIDGILDVKTIEAIKLLQKKNNIPETGELDFQTVIAIKK